MPFLSENRVSILALLRGVTGFRLVLPGLLSLALALPVQAECSWDISPALSPRAVEFIALATQSAGDTSIAEELLGLQLDIRCGDADAIAAIKPFLQQPDTTLVASAMLVDAGHLDALELFGAIRNTPITLERKADLFQLAVDWISRSSTKTSAEIIARRTAWAMASGNEKLIRLAHELRAAHGDEAAAAARATRLMACAEDEDGGVGFDCLGMHELHTGALAEIEPRWNNASMAQRIWLARWARPTQEILLQDTGPGWRLYAKTGWASSNSVPEQTGWYVGYLKSQGKTYTFATQIQATDPDPAIFGPLRRQITLDYLREHKLLH